MKTVVLVEDSLTQATRLKHFLKSYYRIIHAEKASIALEVSAQASPDLIVTDVTMPEMDGFELCRRIKSHESLSHTPVLMLTGMSEPEDIIWGLEAGADSYLTKPYEDEELLSRIEFVLTNAARDNSSPEKTEAVDVSFLGNDYTVRSSKRQILGFASVNLRECGQEQQEARQRELGAKVDCQAEFV